MGSASIRALCKYQSCIKAKTPRPMSRHQVCHLQNWLWPVSVSSKSSTPLFANNKHIPDNRPEADAYEMAKNRGTREGGILVKERSEIDEAREDTGFLSRRGVCSVMAWEVAVIGFDVGGNNMEL